MVRTILAAWLAGEKTLPQAARDWVATRTPKELAVGIAYTLLQSLAGSIALAGAAWVGAVIWGFLVSTPTSKLLELTALWTIAGAVLHLALTGRRLGATLDGSSGRGGSPPDADGGPEKHTSNEQKDGDGHMTAEGGIRG